jgi:hypothetical protein
MTPELWIERYRRAWETADADEIVDPAGASSNPNQAS